MTATKRWFRCSSGCSLPADQKESAPRNEVGPFDRVVPTSENLVVEIWRRLEGEFAKTPARLTNIRLYETDDLFVEYEGR